MNAEIIDAGRDASGGYKVMLAMARVWGTHQCDTNQKIGSEFPLAGDIVSAKTKSLVERTRSIIAISMVCAVGVALTRAFLYSLYVGEFSAVKTVWALVAAPLGWVVVHYFRGSTSNAQENNESATGAS